MEGRIPGDYDDTVLQEQPQAGSLFESCLLREPYGYIVRIIREVISTYKPEGEYFHAAGAILSDNVNVATDWARMDTSHDTT